MNAQPVIATHTLQSGDEYANVAESPLLWRRLCTRGHGRQCKTGCIYRRPLPQQAEAAQ